MCLSRYGAGSEILLQVMLASVLVPNSTLSSCVLDTPNQEAAAFPTAVMAKAVNDVKISNNGRGKWKWD